MSLTVGSSSASVAVVYRDSHGEDENVRLLGARRLVHEQDRPVQLLLCEPPQRRHVALLVDDVPLQDHGHDLVHHLPEHVEHQLVDDPRDTVQPVGELDVRPAPPDAVDDNRRQAEDRDAGLLCQFAEDKTVLPDGDRPQELPVHKDKADLEEQQRVSRQRDPRKRRDVEDVGVFAEFEQEVVLAADAGDMEAGPEERGGRYRG